MTIPKQIRRLSVTFTVVELRDCTRQHGEAFAAWLSQFAAPVDELPPLPGDAESCQSIERDGVFLLPFLDWWLHSETVVGRPRLPNETESGLPREPTVGYRIPLEAIASAPKVKRKQGERDTDGYVVLAY